MSQKGHMWAYIMFIPEVNQAMPGKTLRTPAMPGTWAGAGERDDWRLKTWEVTRGNVDLMWKSCGNHMKSYEIMGFSAF